jgi:hypothetical protein
LQFGLTDSDMECVGIPPSKLGLRRKIMGKYKLENYYDAEEEDEEEDEEDEEEEEEDED